MLASPSLTHPLQKWLREAEIKHGRICMLAFTGNPNPNPNHNPNHNPTPDQVIDDAEFEKDETFQLVLTEATGGAA